MKNELDGIAVGVLAVKTAGLVAVSAWCGLDEYTGVTQVFVPDIDLVQLVNNKANIIEALIPIWGEVRRRPVQREIIAARGKINIIDIGTPFNTHTQEIDIESLAGLEFANGQCNVAYSCGGFGLGHVCLGK